MKLIDNQKLLKEVAELNQEFETSGILLAVGLVKVFDSEAWREAGYDEWSAYYTQELGRKRDVISRMLKAGRFIIENGLVHTNIKSYDRLSRAITMYPDKKPEEVVELANVWNSQDFVDEKRDVCTHPDVPILLSLHCFKRM